jgi:hypothetical protein
MNKFHYVIVVALACCFHGRAQINMVTYAGNAGHEAFLDIVGLSNGKFIVSGYADNLDWVDSDIPIVTLSGAENIHNALGSNRYAFLLLLDHSLNNLEAVYTLPQGSAEDIRFIKLTNQNGLPTGEIFLSGNTSDTYDADGGYFLAKLNNNFVDGMPTGLVWTRNVWAESGPKDYHPWDVTGDGEVYYVSGHSHDYNWSAMYCLDQNGERKVVENWRTHWLTAGGEWHGTPASSSPSNISFSGIVFKSAGRCEFRSWTDEDYNLMQSDGNGGMKKGKWPVDILFSGPCNPDAPTANGPGYTGYSPESCCPVWGASSVVVDRRNNHLYIGMNMKSYGISPDFEPAVIAMNETGELKWWSRLYHEITPAGDTMISVPDQYVDALAIDYSLPADQGMLVVGARSHGNNTENLWEGNTILANSNAHGFQNQFTGTNGDIHESWLGKLRLSDGTLMHSTYLAEMTDGGGNYGTPHANPNLDGWPDPNTGWADVNTTRLAKNAIRVTSQGDVCVAAVGRRTITTANAYQKMIKPWNGGHSCWNNFIRVYVNDLSVPLYSSLVVGQWDTLTQEGGDNVEIYGIFKTELGIIGVGKQKADDLGVAAGNDIPVTNVPTWGVSAPSSETAVLVYYVAENLENESDNPTNGLFENTDGSLTLIAYPVPSSHVVQITGIQMNGPWQLYNIAGEIVKTGNINTRFLQLDISELPQGVFYFSCNGATSRIVKID